MLNTRSRTHGEGHQQGKYNSLWTSTFFFAHPRMGGKVMVVVVVVRGGITVTRRAGLPPW